MGSPEDFHRKKKPLVFGRKWRSTSLGPAQGQGLSTVVINREECVSIDRLKPAYLDSGGGSPPPVTTRSGRRVRPTDRINL
ncbi:Uncharacterised protein r2_g450 [Pycnogonum litorale]